MSDTPSPEAAAKRDRLLAALADLPGDIKFKAEMLLSSATTYERSHPMTATIGGLLWYEADDLDSIWRAAAKR